MPFDAIVRVSFQTSPTANQAAHKALTGVSQGVGPGPFESVGTALYSCRGGQDAVVGLAIAELSDALRQHAAVVDFASITLVRRP